MLKFALNREILTAQEGLRGIKFVLMYILDDLLMSYLT